VTIILNKPRAKAVAGLGNIPIPAPIAEWQRMQNNNDGTVTVIIAFYRDQEAVDAGEEAFDTHSYQINAHANIDTYLKNELIKLSDFNEAS
jgi:hypothetical protein